MFAGTRRDKTIRNVLISARVWWFHYVMGEGSADLSPMVEWDGDGLAHTAAELVNSLEITWHMIQSTLASWTPADLGQTFPRRDTSVSHQWIIWHVIEHDLHHGGELSFALGMHGPGLLQEWEHQAPRQGILSGGQVTKGQPPLDGA